MGVKGIVSVTGRKLAWSHNNFIAQVAITSVQCILNVSIIVITTNPECLINLPLPFFAAMRAMLKLADS